MKLFLRLTIVSFALMLGVRIQAQTPTFTMIVENVDDTAYYYNDTIHVSLLLTNNDSAVYNGSAQLGYQTLNGGTATTSTVPGFQQSIQGLGLGQTVILNVNIPVSASFFMDGGGHTVIVWPILSNLPPGSTVDSTEFEIDVLGWLNQTDWAIEKQAKIFPVPASDYIILEKPPGTSSILVLDILGKTVSAIISNETQVRISLQHLSAGKYFIKYSDGTKPPEIHSFIKH